MIPEGDLKVHEDRKLDTSHGDHERFAHYVDKNDMMSSRRLRHAHQGAVRQGLGAEPGPQKFPVCPECKEIYEALPPGDDDGGE